MSNTSWQPTVGRVSTTHVTDGKPGLTGPSGRACIETSSLQAVLYVCAPDPECRHEVLGPVSGDKAPLAWLSRWQQDPDGERLLPCHSSPRGCSTSEQTVHTRRVGCHPCLGSDKQEPPRQLTGQRVPVHLVAGSEKKSADAPLAPCLAVLMPSSGPDPLSLASGSWGEAGPLVGWHIPQHQAEARGPGDTVPAQVTGQVDLVSPLSRLPEVESRHTGV